MSGRLTEPFTDDYLPLFRNHFSNLTRPTNNAAAVQPLKDSFKNLFLLLEFIISQHSSTDVSLHHCPFSQTLVNHTSFSVAVSPQRLRAGWWRRERTLSLTAITSVFTHANSILPKAKASQLTSPAVSRTATVLAMTKQQCFNPRTQTRQQSRELRQPPLKQRLICTFHSLLSLTFGIRALCNGGEMKRERSCRKVAPRLLGNNVSTGEKFR